MNLGLVPKILKWQNDQGYWETPDRFYITNYKSTAWQLIIIAELEADGSDESIKKTCEFILENSQDYESRGFSILHSARIDGGS